MLLKAAVGPTVMVVMVLMVMVMALLYLGVRREGRVLRADKDAHRLNALPKKRGAERQEAHAGRDFPTR